jgi:putative Mg2+ transporter-C (MgtC) family protein
MSNFAQLLEYLRQLNMASLLLRLTLALLFGGLIGLERERKRRPAGFRTYMLVCLGAALTMLLSQYEAVMLTTRWAPVAQSLGLTTDVSRFGAQVINGIGFLGAGTVIVTGRQEVKGLTTAAGLWTSACMGLAIGAGFYECVLPGFLLILLCVRVFPYIENRATARSRNMSIYLEVRSMEDMGAVLQYLRSMEMQIFDVDLARKSDTGLARPNAVISVQLPRREQHAAILAALSKLDSICTIEEL